jgi:hypothetical protein
VLAAVRIRSSGSPRIASSKRADQENRWMIGTGNEKAAEAERFSAALSRIRQVRYGE